MWSDEPGFAELAKATGVTGICGSGIIEVMAELFLAGVIAVPAGLPVIPPLIHRLQSIVRDCRPRLIIANDRRHRFLRLAVIKACPSLLLARWLVLREGGSETESAHWTLNVTISLIDNFVSVHSSDIRNLWYCDELLQLTQKIHGCRVIVFCQRSERFDAVNFASFDGEMYIADSNLIYTIKCRTSLQ